MAVHAFYRSYHVIKSWGILIHSFRATPRASVTYFVSVKNKGNIKKSDPTGSLRCPLAIYLAIQALPLASFGEGVASQSRRSRAESSLPPLLSRAQPNSSSSRQWLLPPEGRGRRSLAAPSRREGPPEPGCSHREEWTPEPGCSRPEGGSAGAWLLPPHLLPRRPVSRCSRRDPAKERALASRPHWSESASVAAS